MEKWQCNGNLALAEYENIPVFFLWTPSFDIACANEVSASKQANETFCLKKSNFPFSLSREVLLEDYRVFLFLASPTKTVFCA